jgi:hypothetical protein
LLFGCSRSDVVEGALYATPADEGGYHILKVLKVDEVGVHIRGYSNYFSTLPGRVDEKSLYLAGTDYKPPETLGLGHLPLSRQTFASWKPVFVQQSSVSHEELDGYEEWKKGHGGYF